jgi:hypothetical protein
MQYPMQYQDFGISHLLVSVLKRELVVKVGQPSSVHKDNVDL